MLFKFLLLISLLPIGLAVLARWWFGLRVLAAEGGRSCRADLERWLPAPGDTAVVHRAEGLAADFGAEMRRAALHDWREQDPKGVKSRESALRFGLAVPPLVAMIAIFAVVVGKIPILGAIAVFVAATALAAAFGLLTLPPELAAITRRARKMREIGSFPDPIDEALVIRCAKAHAWDHALPPVLRWLKRGKARAV